MNELQEALAAQVSGNPDPASVVQALIIAFVLGLIVGALHRWSLPHRLVPPKLVASLALLPVVTALVLHVIGNSLARAFGLVGALAIVRFRTRLRSTWDITFIFLSLAVGIACGVGNPVAAALGTLVAALAVAILGVLPGARPQEEIVVLRCDVAAYQCGEAQLIPAMEAHTLKRWLKSTRSMRFGESLSLNYCILLKKGASIEALTRDLSAIEGVERVTILSDDGDAGT